MAEFDIDAYLNSPPKAPPPVFNADTYSKNVESSLEKVPDFDPDAYLLGEKNVETGEFETNTAIQNYNNLKASKKQKDELSTTFDTELNTLFDLRDQYKNKSEAGPEVVGQGTGQTLATKLPTNFKIPRGANLATPIGYEKRPGSQKQGDASSIYDQNIEFQEKYDAELKELKTARDTHPLTQFLKDAKFSLQTIQDPEDPTKTIPNPEKITRENVIALAKENYLKAKETNILQNNVYNKVDEMINETPDTFFGIKGLETKQDNIVGQTKEIKKIKGEMTDLEKNRLKNLGYLNSLANNVESLNNEVKKLSDGIEDRSEYFKDVNENSSPEKIEELRKYISDVEIYTAKFEILDEKRQIALDAYQDRYKNQTKILDPKFKENYEGLGEYLNLMDKNGHFLTGLGASFAASTVEIAGNLESQFAEILLLPQGLKDDTMLGGTRLAKTLGSWADNFEEWREENYKEDFRKVSEDLRNGIQPPETFEEAGEDLESAGRWAAYGVANFLPQLGALYVGGAKGLTLLSASASGGSLDQSRLSNKRGETDYSFSERWIHGGLAFGAEYVSEKVTLGLIRGAGGVAQDRIKKSFGEQITTFLKPQLIFPKLLKTGYRMGSEGLSEVGATVFGQNLGDKYLFGKKVSLYDGIKESFVTGMLMERTIAAPGIAKGVMSPFTGKEYDQQVGELETRKRQIETTLKNGGLSDAVKGNLRAEYLELQQKQDDIVSKQAENVDMLSEPDVTSLIDLDVQLNNAKQQQDDINNDKSLTKKQKETELSVLQKKEADIVSQKNKILAKAESEETRAKRVEDYEKQKAIVKEKIAKFNKRKIKQFKDTNDGARGKVVEFETQEEQQAFFNNRNAEADAAERAEIAEMQELLKNPNTSRADRITIQNNLAFLRQSLNARSQESKSNSSSFGFISQESDGSFTVYLNKENSVMAGGNVNVAAHEFLHATLYKTIGGNKAVQDKLGEAVQTYVQKNKGGFSDGFVKKISPYLNADNVGEEMITVMSESILDGTLKFNDTFFTKIGDLIRQNLQRVGIIGIKFNTGKDVYNFIKDYNASIEKNYNSKAIDRLMDFGVKGKLVQGVKKIKPTIQYSKSAFENDQVVNDLGLKKETADIVAKNKEIEKRILAEGLKDSNGNIKASPALQRELAKNNLPRAFALARQAAGRAKDLTLDDALKIDNVMEFYSEYSLKLTELANTYRARKDGKEVPFGAYMNTLLPLKYSSILEKLKSKIQADRIEDESVAKKVAKKIAPKDDGKKELEGTAVALEQMGHKDIMPKLQDIYNVNKSKVKKLGTYKDVKNAISRAKQQGPFYQALVEVSDIFTNENFTAENLAKRILNKQDLTKEMRKAIQDKILKSSPEMITMVPDGTTVGGDATGIANSKLGVWYNKQGRSKFADTGTGKGLPVQQKQGLNIETFRSPFGIAVKGQRVTNKSVDGALREWVMQVATLAMNQAGRKADPNNVALLKTKEGKNPFQFSKSTVNNIVQVNSTFEVEYNGKDKLLKFHNLKPSLRIKTPKDIDIYVDMLKRDVFPLLPKEAFFGPRGGTSLTSSSKNLGMSSSNPLWKEFVKRIKTLNQDTSIQYGDPINGVDAKTMYSLRNKYGKLFKNPATIEQAIKNGEVAKFNKEVAAVHEAMWKRIKQAINNDKNAATGIASYLGFVANDTGHWHKLGAQFAGYSKEITGKRYEYEHAMPATAAYLYLLDAALTDGVDFDSAYGLVIDNYKLIALDKAMDDKLRNARTERGYSLQRRMPDNWDLIKDRWLDRYFNDIVMAQDGGINPNSIIALNGKTFAKEHGISFSKVPEFANFDKNNTIQKAIQFSKNTKNPTNGITVLDFDDTLATTKSLVKYTTPEGKTGTLNAEQYASTYQDLLEQGYTFDFSDFNKVVGGKLAPLFQKALKLQNKFGPSNMFVLTARPPQAAQAIYDFLKANGLNIPLQNITGLANSTSEAKALWIADKVGKGYNDFYFADDALQNVQAVKNMLDQFDVKSKVQQAKIQFSKPENLDAQINNIIEQNTGVEKQKRFSSAEGRARGIGKGKYKLWIPAGAEDFMGLMYTIASGKGKKGEAQLDFIKKSLLEPYNNGIISLNRAKQELSGNYKALLKQHPDVKKLLQKKIEGTNFTYDHAVRVYLWNKAGFEIPGLTPTTKQKLLDAVENFQELKGFANSLGKITKVQEGYPTPNADWVAETIIADLAKATEDIGRAEFLKEFKQNAEIIFSEQNLNKIEAIYGKDYRDALENMLYRMNTGRNKSTGTTDAQVNRWTTWITNSIGAIMFLNMRSAILQTISAANFINWSDNNPLKAAAAFANQKQFWSDFTMIFNSPYLKQRRSGLKTDVNEAQLANALAGKKNKVTAALAYLLKLGFTPTQIADSFAIASGGASFYRNRVKALIKEGMSKEQAEQQAFADMQEVANVSQQSSDPSLISRQQASILGRFILAFQNTPMQYARIMKKAGVDLVKGRGDWKSNVSKIIYYGAVQNIIFNAMQQALFALAFSDDEEDEKILQKNTRLINGMTDSILRGTGIYGAIVATGKNIALEFWKQDQKGGRADHAYTMLQFANISPPIGSKMRKLYSATQTRKFNRDAMEQMGYDLYNPAVPAIATAVEAFTNLPTGRAYQKFNNITEAFNEENQNWQRIALMMGWNTWDLGIKQSFKVNKKSKGKSKSKYKSKYKKKWKN